MKKLIKIIGVLVMGIFVMAMSCVIAKADDGKTSNVDTKEEISVNEKEVKLRVTRNRKQVKAFQAHMNEFVYNYPQYDEVEVDGKYGPATKKLAIIIWQNETNLYYGTNLTVDGKFGPKCKEASKRVVLTSGKDGGQVAVCSGILNGLGYSHEYTTTYNKDLIKAVKDFQKDNGLTVDGKCGPATWEALFSK